MLNPEKDEAEKFIQQVEQTRNEIQQIGGINIQVSIDIGYARSPKDCSDVNELIKLSSLAMKQAGFKGGNQSVAFERSMLATLETNISLAAKLKDAMASHEIYPVFQNIYNVTNHKVIFTEALARWRDSSGVFIPPNTFLQIAKESGLSDVLDEYLLDAVFGEYVKLRPQSEYRETMLTINLMPSSFLSQRFVDFLKKSMKKHSLNPENIMIEISEKTFVNDLTTCILFIEKYKKDGFKIAIDDFGSEYSALNILGRISYDVLKLEGNFGMNTLRDVNETIVRMVKSITDLTDKKIVVEGVETAEQSEKLANLGCIYQQGYYHHRPSKLT